MSNEHECCFDADACRAPELCHRIRDLEAEVDRLKAGGCARDQRTTQFCAEAVRLQKRIEELETTAACLADERDTAFMMSKCECGPKEACRELTKLRKRAEAAEAEVERRTAAVIIHLGQALAASDVVCAAYNDLKQKREAAEAKLAKVEGVPKHKARIVGRAEYLPSPTEADVEMASQVVSAVLESDIGAILRESEDT